MAAKVELDIASRMDPRWLREEKGKIAEAGGCTHRRNAFGVQENDGVVRQDGGLACERNPLQKESVSMESSLLPRREIVTG